MKLLFRIKNLQLLIFCVLIFCPYMHGEETDERHLFILSGQSNMARFKPSLWFTPALSKALGEDRVIVSFYAKGGQPISKWYKGWKGSDGSTDPQAGVLYDTMMEQARDRIRGSKIKTVTFIWMQGEADAKAKNSEVYLNGLHGLRKQLESDLGREDLGFVIGRLSDSGFYRRRDKKRVENSAWKGIRDAQEAFANSTERAVWIDTDDLNGEKNELHLIKPGGYETLGKRYVDAALKLVNGK